MQVYNTQGLPVFQNSRTLLFYTNTMRNRTNERIVFDLNKMGIPRCQQFGHYQYTHVRPGLKNHTHTKVLEICYFLKGRQYYKIGDNLHELSGNDIIIIEADIDHSTDRHPEDKGELYWFQISLEKNKGKLCYLPHDQSDHLLQQLIKNANRIFKGSFKMKFVLMKLMRELQEPKSTMRALSINQLILQLLMDTLTLSENQQPSVPLERFQSIDDFILKNIERSIFVDELATLIDLSTSYFKDWFKKNKGIPPKEYINRKKIEKAKTDLLIKKSITQVAYDLGFGSSQYFATVFKKYSGTTPKSYIAAKRKGQSTLWEEGK